MDASGRSSATRRRGFVVRRLAIPSGSRVARYVMTVEDTATVGFITRVTETLTGRGISLPGVARVVADPIRPRVFVLDSIDVRALDLDTGTTTVLASARSVPAPACRRSCRYPRRISPRTPGSCSFAGRTRQERPGKWSSSTWRAVRWFAPFPISPPPASDADWIVVPDGTRLFAIGGGDFVTGPLGARAIDATTGLVLASAPASGRLRWDDVHQRLYVVGNLTGALKAFDHQLTPLGQTDSGYCFSNVRVSPHSGRLYHLRAAGGGGSYYGAIDTRLEALRQRHRGATRRRERDRRRWDWTGIARSAVRTPCCWLPLLARPAIWRARSRGVT